MTEKPLQKKYIDLLNKLELPFIHLKNAGNKRGSCHDSLGESCLKNFPDLQFAFNDKIYLREFGIKGSNMHRKAKQVFKMGWWKKHGGVDILIINNEDGMREDWETIGLVK